MLWGGGDANTVPCDSKLNHSLNTHTQKDVQPNLPMTIMGIFGLIGAFALFMFRDGKATATTAPDDKRYAN